MCTEQFPRDTYTSPLLLLAYYCHKYLAVPIGTDHNCWGTKAGFERQGGLEIFLAGEKVGHLHFLTKNKRGPGILFSDGKRQPLYFSK